MKTVIALACLFLASTAEAKTIRATEITDSLWTKLQGAKEEVTIEFREKDELPVTFTASGDLLETSRPGVSYVSVKRDFWIKVNGKNFTISFDGENFQPIQDALTGRFTAGVGSDENGGIANAIKLGLDAKISK